MCGIVGVVDFRSPVQPAVIASMRDALTHRGPDDAGMWTSDGGQPWVGLGHRRLSIIDLSPSGRQPMVSRDGRKVLVFNGEIYNYRELLPQLEAAGHHFCSDSDTEVLLAAYETWGADCVGRLNGMWAFAIWDDERRELFASRDRLGKKPLFYYWDGARLALASEMKALFQHPAIDARVDEDSLEDYCRTFVTDRDAQTLFAGIRQLPPGHQLLLRSSGRLEKRRYWNIDPDATIHFNSTEEYVERFSELFEDAVRLRLRADVAVGSSLSGGLDSSMIVGTVARLRGRQESPSPQRTFSARFPAIGALDEGPFIDEVVGRIDAEAHAVSPSADRLLETWAEVHRHQEEPIQSTSIFAQWEVMRLAREHNTIVLLDGQGADELLAGYVPYLATHLIDLASSGHWLRAWREYQSFMQRQRSWRRQYPDVDQPAFQLSLPAMLAGGLKKLRRRRSARHRSRPPAQQPVRGPHRSRLWSRLAADVTTNSLPTLLRYADRNAMAHGVEVRNPFLDYRLVEFVMAAPEGVKFMMVGPSIYSAGPVRTYCRSGFSGRVDKVGYLTPEDRWLRGELKTWAGSVLLGPRLAECPGYPVESHPPAVGTTPGRCERVRSGALALAFH